MLFSEHRGSRSSITVVMMCRSGSIMEGMLTEEVCAVFGTWGVEVVDHGGDGDRGGMVTEEVHGTGQQEVGGTTVQASMRWGRPQYRPA